VAEQRGLHLEIAAAVSAALNRGPNDRNENSVQTAAKNRKNEKAADRRYQRVKLRLWRYRSNCDRQQTPGNCQGSDRQSAIADHVGPGTL